MKESRDCTSISTTSRVLGHSGRGELVGYSLVGAGAFGLSVQVPIVEGLDWHVGRLRAVAGDGVRHGSGGQSLAPKFNGVAGTAA